MINEKGGFQLKGSITGSRQLIFQHITHVHTVQEADMAAADILPMFILFRKLIWQQLI